MNERSAIYVESALVGWPTRLREAFFGLYVLSLLVSISAMEVFSGVLLLIVCVGFATKKDVKPVLPPLFAPMLGFTLAYVISSLWNGNGLGIGSQLSHAVRFSAVYFVLFYYIHLFGMPRFTLKLLAWGVLCVCLYGVVQHFVPLDLVRPEGAKVFRYAIGAEKIGPLVLGTFDHHLTYANVFLFYAVLFLALGIQKGYERWYLVGLSALVFLTVTWTQSRVAWVAILVTTFLTGCLKSFKAGALFLGAAILCFVVTYFTSSGFRERFERTLVRPETQYNLSYRQKFWQIHWEIFKDHPVVGIGGQNLVPVYSKQLFPNSDTVRSNAHNTPLEILARTGALGFLSYLWLWAAVAVMCVRAYLKETDSDRRALLGALGVALVGFNVQGLTQVNLAEPVVMHTLMFFLAVLASLSVNSRLLRNSS